MRKQILLLSMVLFSTLAVAQTNVAYLYSSKVFEKYPEYKAAQEKINDYAEREQKSIESQMAQVKSLFELYQNNVNTMSQTELNNLKEMIVAQEKSANEYQEKIFGEGGEMGKMQKQYMQPIESDLMNIVAAISKERNYTMVFDLSIVKNTIYQSEQIDITDIVLQRLLSK